MTILSSHAAERARQRGIGQEAIQLIVQNGDVEFDVGDDCQLIRLSRKAAISVAAHLGRPQIAEQLSSFAVIDSGRSGQIVSVIRDHSGPSGRRYRRPLLGRNPKYRSRRRPRRSSGDFQ